MFSVAARSTFFLGGILTAELASSKSCLNSAVMLKCIANFWNFMQMPLCGGLAPIILRRRSHLSKQTFCENRQPLQGIYILENPELTRTCVNI